MLPVSDLDTLPRGKRVMGLDLGTKTIGLALSDGERRIASPLETIRRTKFKADAAALLALAEHQGSSGRASGGRGRV
jgi:putative Holliday junction resolvase